MNSKERSPSPAFSYQSIVGIVFFLYLAPVVLLSFYSLGMMPLNDSWNIFSMGLIMSITGSLYLFWLLHKRMGHQVVEREESPPVPVIAPEVNIVQPNSQNEEQAALLTQLSNELQTKNSELQYLYGQVEEFQQRLQTAKNEVEIERVHVQEFLEQQELCSMKYQAKILEQDALIKRQQESMEELEERNRELSYEIKTLLTLTRE